MSDFLIRSSDLRMLREIADLCERIIENAQVCRRAVNKIRELSGFTGSFADSVKYYYEKIHIVVLQYTIYFAEIIKESVSAYVNGYAEIEGGEFLLCKRILADFSSELLQRCNEAEEISEKQDQIMKETAQLTDYFGSEGSFGLIHSKSNAIKKGIQELQTSIEQLEALFLRDTEYSEELLTKLRTALKKISVIEWFGNCEHDYSIVEMLNVEKEKNTKDGYYHILRAKGLTNEEITKLDSLGMTPETLLLLCEAEADWDFLKDLLNGRYEEAFSEEHNQRKLSAGINIVLAEYALALFDRVRQSPELADGNQAGVCANSEFDDFINGILSSEGSFEAYEGYAGTEGAVEWVSNCNEYLLRLCMGTTSVLNANSAYILSEGYNNNDISVETRNINWNCLELLSVSENLYMICSEKGERNYYYKSQYLNDSVKTGSKINYTLQYPEPSILFIDEWKSKLITINSEICWSSDALGEAILDNKYMKLKKAEDEYYKKIIDEGSDLLISLIATVCPAAGAALGIGKEVIDGSIKEEYDDHINEMVDKDVETTSGHVLTKSIGAIVNMAQSLIKENDTLKKEGYALDKETLEYYFGTGIISEFDGQQYIISGVYDPDTLEKIGKWNREGICALVEEELAESVNKLKLAVTEGDSDAICWLEENGYTYQMRIYREYYESNTLQYKLLNGFEEGESLLDYEPELMKDAIEDVETMLQALGLSGDISIKDYFDNTKGANRG